MWSYFTNDASSYSILLIHSETLKRKIIRGMEKERGQCIYA